MAARNETVFGLTLALRNDRAKRIEEQVPGEASTAEKLQAVASGLMLELADGGMMLPSSAVSAIESSLGASFTADTLVAAADKSAGKRGGAVVAEWIVDPVWIEPLKAVAEQQGLGFEALIQNMMDHAVANGWFYSLGKQPKQVHVSDADDRFLTQVLGTETYTGHDLAQFCREKVLENDGALFGLSDEEKPAELVEQ